MKTYKITGFLAIFVTLLVGFASIADQAGQLFAAQTANTGEQTTASSDAEIDINLSKIEPIEQQESPAITSNPKITAPKPAPQPTAPARPATPCRDFYGYITIGGRTICLAITNTTGGNLSYNHAYIYNTPQSQDKFIFGHNSNGIFNHLKNLSNGSIFSVTIQGKTTTYRVSFKEVSCDYSNPTYPCSNYPNDPVLNMYDAILPSRRGADLALMTCSGTPIGNGDATHRLMVYANRV